MGRFLMWVAVVALQIYTLIDIIRTPSAEVRLLPKPLWILLWLVPLFGPVGWLVLGRPRVGPSSGEGPGGPGPLGGPRRPRGPVAPDDDPAFLKSLDERSWGERMERMRRERAQGSPGESENPLPPDPEEQPRDWTR